MNKRKIYLIYFIFFSTSVVCRKVYSSHNTPFHGCSTSSSAHHCRRKIIRLSDVLNLYSVLKEMKIFRVRVFDIFLSSALLLLWDVLCSRSCATNTRFFIEFVVGKRLYERNTSSRQGVSITAHEHRIRLRTRVFFTSSFFVYCDHLEPNSRVYLLLWVHVCVLWICTRIDVCVRDCVRELCTQLCLNIFQSYAIFICYICSLHRTNAANVKIPLEPCQVWTVLLFRFM